MSDIYEEIRYKKYSKLTKAQRNEMDNGDLELCTCERCDDIGCSWSETYWKGEDSWVTNVILDEYEAVCDDCYFELSKKWKANLRILYYKTIDFFKGVAGLPTPDA